MTKKDNVERSTNKTGLISVLSLSVALYVFFTFRPFFTWFPSPFIFFIPVFLVILIYSWILVENNTLVITKKRLFVSLSILFFAVYIGTPLFSSSFNLFVLLKFVILLILSFFPVVIFRQAFLILRKLMIVFSVASIVLFLLLLFNINLPYYKIPGFTTVMENTNHFYRLYGIVVSSTNTVWPLYGFNIARMCGPFLEPGHFAIYLGLILSLEKYLSNKINPFLVIAGFLTFSPAFIFILTLIVAYDILFNKQVKLLVNLSIATIVVFSVVITSPIVRDAIYYMAIGRNFDNVDGNILDERSSSNAQRAYKAFIQTNDAWIGVGVEKSNEKGMLADYRGFVFANGIIGIILSLSLSLQLFFGMNKKSAFLLFPIFLIVFSHRSWMFYNTYIYAFMLMASIFSENKKHIIYRK